MSRHDKPLGAIARGIAAGVVGTGFMTVAQTLSAKLQSPDGSPDQETVQPQGQQDPWEQASVPAKVARRKAKVSFTTRCRRAASRC